MVSFDMSTTNIVLTAAVVGLIVFFIALLMKLNPSTEEKKLETKGEGEKQKSQRQSREHLGPRDRSVASPQLQAGTGVVSSRRDCQHQFGYLRTFPKKSPIPAECFGCERMADCLVDNKKPNGKNETGIKNVASS